MCRGSFGVMRRVDPGQFVAVLEQMRVNMGLSKGELSRRIGRANGFWSSTLKIHEEGGSSLMAISTANKILGIFGLCLYIGRVDDGGQE